MALTVISSDEISYSLDRNEYELSTTIKEMVAETGIEIPITLHNIENSVLSKIVTWMRYKAAQPMEIEEEPKEEPKNKKPKENESKEVDMTKFKNSPWEDEFFNIPKGLFFEMILAANHLDTKDLIHICLKNMAILMCGKTTPQLEEEFKIPEDELPRYLAMGLLPCANNF